MQNPQHHLPQWGVNQQMPVTPLRSHHTSLTCPGVVVVQQGDVVWLSHRLSDLIVKGLRLQLGHKVPLHQALRARLGDAVGQRVAQTQV